jgi:hypothetical protein
MIPDFAPIVIFFAEKVIVIGMNMTIIKTNRIFYAADTSPNIRLRLEAPL